MRPSLLSLRTCASGTVVDATSNVGVGMTVVTPFQTYEAATAERRQ